MSENEFDTVDLFLQVDIDTLSWSESNERKGHGIRSLASKRFASLCIAVKREANRRERENGFRLKLEEES